MDVDLYVKVIKHPPVSVKIVYINRPKGGKKSNGKSNKIKKNNFFQKHLDKK